MPTLLGHGDVAGKLLAARTSGRLAHAYLFVGRNGVGKGTFARQWAASLLCAQGQARAEQGLLSGCGSCAPCGQAAGGSHPDFLRVEPEEGKRTLPIKAVRAAQDLLALQSYGGGWRVALVEGAEALSLEACNALLKTLEEPGAGTILVLTAASERELLPTIRSRCQIVRFRPVPAVELVPWLKAEWKLDGERASFLAGLSGGAPGFCAHWCQADRWKDLELWRKVEQESKSRGAWTAAQLWADALDGECETQEQARERLREQLRMAGYLLEREGRFDALPAVADIHAALEGNVNILLSVADLLSRLAGPVRFAGSIGSDVR